MEYYSNEVTQELTPEESERLISEIRFLQDSDCYEVQVAMSSVIGTRESQQDSCYTDVVMGTNAVGIVCDGMGGLQGGELASQTAVKMFVEDYEVVRHTETNFYDFFRDEMMDIDTMVSHLKDEDGEYLNAGTTLVAVSISDGYVQWVSVGDSKIYIIRGDDMVCVTKEHNYMMLLNERLLNDSITEQEYAVEAKRGAALISYLGMGNVSIMDLNPNPLKLEDGDIILLCSDGLYKALSEEQIFNIVNNDITDLETTIQTLQEEACIHSPDVQDNTSIVLMLYKETDNIP